jgi:3'-5' exoribonuclease Rv2179c-like domain
MLDLETLGTTPGCVILSIGAVAFDSTAVFSTFEVLIDPRSCQRAGLTIDADTVMWWLGQEEAARAAFFQEPAIPLNVALEQFSFWMNASERPARLWSKGPSFDAAVLAAAYRAVRLDVPWDFRQERCVRTILDLMGVDASNYRETRDTSSGAGRCHGPDTRGPRGPAARQPAAVVSGARRRAGEGPSVSGR